MVGVDIIEDIKIAKVTPKSIYNMLSLSRSRIQSTQSRFELIKFDNNKR